MPEHVSIEYDHPGKCPICGMTLVPVTATHAREASARRQAALLHLPDARAQRRARRQARQMSEVRHDADSRDDRRRANRPSSIDRNRHQQLYTCPMASRDVVSDKPGKCPKCGMELVEHRRTANRGELAISTGDSPRRHAQQPDMNSYAQTHHRFFAQEQIHRPAGDAGAGAGRRLCGAQHSARRHSRPLGRAGHHLHRVARPGAANRPGPGHLSDHDQDAFRAASQSRARLFVLRLLVRLCDFRGRHRSLLGAQPRARISQRPQRPACRKGVTPIARSGRHRRRLGVHVFASTPPTAISPNCARCRTGICNTNSPRCEASPKSPRSAAS